jgi:hypothetical protein
MGLLNAFNNGKPVKIPSPTVAVLIRRERETDDYLKMEVTGTAVIYRHPQIALTAGHVHHTGTFPGSGLVYCPYPKAEVETPFWTNILHAVRKPDLDIKVLILEKCVPEIETIGATVGAGMGTMTLCSGYGGVGLKEPHHPPVQHEFEADFEPGDDSDHFIVRAKKEIVTNPGDSGSPAFARTVDRNPFLECYGIFSKVAVKGLHTNLVFVSLTDTLKAWISDVASDYDIELDPE